MIDVLDLHKIDFHDTNYVSCNLDKSGLTIQGDMEEKPIFCYIYLVSSCISCYHHISIASMMDVLVIQIVNIDDTN